MRRGWYGGPAAFLAGPLLLASGCSTASGGGAAGSCAGIVVRGAATYLPRSVDHPVRTTGPVLSARMPACDDTPNDDDSGAPASTVHIRAIRGVRLQDAFGVTDAPSSRPGHHLVYVRYRLVRHPHSAPAALQRLLG